MHITSPKALRKMFKAMAQEDFDLLIHCGDYNGGSKGAGAVKLTLDMIRAEMPEIPILSVLGNHCFYHPGKRLRFADCIPGVRTHGHPSFAQFQINYDKICQTFKDNNVHFLDEDGIYQNPDFPEVIICGHTGWYNFPDPPTIDANYLPLALEGHTHKYMERRARAAFFKQLDALDKFYDAKIHELIFVSHFPVINSVDDQKGSFEMFSWDERLGDMLQEDYKCKFFLNGHSHRLCKGPLRWESGSDYYNPKYHIIGV